MEEGAGGKRLEAGPIRSGDIDLRVAVGILDAERELAVGGAGI